MLLLLDCLHDISTLQLLLIGTLLLLLIGTLLYGALQLFKAEQRALGARKITRCNMLHGRHKIPHGWPTHYKQRQIIIWSQNNRDHPPYQTLRKSRASIPRPNRTTWARMYRHSSFGAATSSTWSTLVHLSRQLYSIFCRGAHTHHEHSRVYCTTNPSLGSMLPASDLGAQTEKRLTTSRYIIVAELMVAHTSLMAGSNRCPRGVPTR